MYYFDTFTIFAAVVPTKILPLLDIQTTKKKNRKHGKAKKEKEDVLAAEEESPLQDARNCDQNGKAKEEEGEQEFIQVLHNVNISITPGELIGIAGAIGSGKSSLISAITGEV